MPEADKGDPMPRALWALSTDSFARADRFEAWHEALSAFNDVRVSPEQRQRFSASTSYWSLGQLVVANSAATSLQLIRGAAQAARDQLDHDVVVVIGSGETRTETGGQSYGLAGGEVAFGNMLSGYTFSVASTAMAQWSELICPPALRDRLAELGSGGMRAGNEQTPQSRLLGQFIRSVVEQLPMLASDDLPLIEQAILCLLAAAGREASGPARLSDAGRQTVDRANAVAIIERELFSARLTADRVCELAGLSRSTLYRLFEGDSGVASYIRVRRLDVLRGDLVDPRKRGHTVAHLAEQRGLHSLSTLNRAFKKRFGCTPGDIRAAPTRTVPSPDTARIDGMIAYLRTQGLA